MKKMVTKTKEKKKLEETEEKRANEELRRNEKKNRKKERRDLTFTVVAGVWVVVAGIAGGWWRERMSDNCPRKEWEKITHRTGE